MNKFFTSFFLLLVFEFGIASEVFDKIIFTVGKEAITQKELELSYRRIENTNLANNQNSLTLKQKAQHLQELMDELLFVTAAEKLKINVSLQEINNAIEVFQQTNNLNNTDLKKLFNLQNINYEYFQEQFRKKILVEKLLKDEIAAKIPLNQFEIKAEYQKKYQDKKTSVYYLWHIFRKNEDTKNVKKELLSFKKNLTKDNFQQKAKLYSQDLSAKQGGVLTPLKKDEMLTEISQAVEKIKIGEITPIIKTDTGYHLFYLADIQEDNLAPDFKEVEQDISRELYNKKYQKFFEQYRKNLQKKYPVNIRDSQLKKLLLDYAI